MNDLITIPQENLKDLQRNVEVLTLKVGNGNYDNQINNRVINIIKRFESLQNEFSKNKSHCEQAIREIDKLNNQKSNFKVNEDLEWDLEGFEIELIAANNKLAKVEEKINNQSSKRNRILGQIQECEEKLQKKEKLEFKIEKQRAKIDEKEREIENLGFYYNESEKLEEELEILTSDLLYFKDRLSEFDSIVRKKANLEMELNSLPNYEKEYQSILREIQEKEAEFNKLNLKISKEKLYGNTEIDNKINSKMNKINNRMINYNNKIIELYNETEYLLSLI